MGFISDISRLMKVATKPDKRELWLIIRVTLLGMGLLGLLGYIIKIAGNEIFNVKPVSNTSTPTGTAAFLIIQILFPLIPYVLNLI